MKKTGIVRRIDELGRYVIPKETRDILDIKSSDSLEVFIDGEDIILRKYAPGCIFCDKTKNLTTYKDKKVCNDCIKEMDSK